MQLLKQVFAKYAQNGKIPPNLFWQAVADYYQAKEHNTANVNQIPQIIQKNGMPLPTVYDFEDFVTFALNFSMMVIYESGQQEEYASLYALLVYSSIDREGVGYVDTYEVMKNLIDYYSKAYPGLNQQMVEQELARNNYKLGPKISEDEFINIYKCIGRLFAGKETQG